MSTKLDAIIQQSRDAFATISLEDWEFKHSPTKWSRKEILGHLVDSAINNLQRFTEIAYSSVPYKVIPYSQDELVLANKYQDEPVELIISLWASLNRHIDYVMGTQSPGSLAMAVQTNQPELVNLEWLMNDYVEHLKHHLKQILGNTPVK